jgi:D-beta-D-heptose 7-phosphate kinase/D-beta-D-heptose 1-phosphate adenosyltransferase
MTLPKNTGLNDAALVRAMAGKAVLVAGDVMLDRFVTGGATRLSPEAPVPVLAATARTTALGGAGNVLANLAGLGVTAHIVALTGEDETADEVAAIVRGLGARSDGLVRDSGRPTTVKTRFMAGPHHLLRVDDEKSAVATVSVQEELIARAGALLPHVQALVLSDYGKGVLSPTVTAALIALAREQGVPVLVDPKGADYTRYNGAQVVTPNRKELAEAAEAGALKSDADIVAAAQTVLRDTTIGAVVATRSEDGISIIPRGEGEITHIPTAPLQVYDVAGAGDTVIATLAAALAAGADLRDAARLANRAGGIVVTRAGTAAITAADLGADATIRPFIAPVCNWDGARAQIRAWQAQGLRVGFTNGCFDILHYGHVSYLAEARLRCDRLVIGLNADASVTRLKGPERPVNDETARATVLAGLRCVDMVVHFGHKAAEDDRPSSVIDTLRPDVIFKGGDYTEDQLPEAAVVRAYGGEVQIMTMFDGYSTTGTIAKLKG